MYVKIIVHGNNNACPVLRLPWDYVGCTKCWLTAVIVLLVSLGQ
jgi:hypothetical protein